MAFITIPSADVDQGSVIDESLMSGKIKNDLDDLDARTIALEALSGVGGVTAAAVEDLFADIVSGGEDDLAKFWKVRHHVMMNTTGQGLDSEGADAEQSEVYDRFFQDPNFTVVSAMQSNAQAYLSSVYFIEQNEQIQFRIKKGENFFCIGTYIAAAAASVWRVYVDGVNVNTLGLSDENGDTVTSSFSSNNATTAYGKLFHFYGLDGNEHVVTIKNENASALEIPLQFVDVGFRSIDYAIDHTVHVKAGIANVGGIAADFNDGSYSFSRPGIGLANGYTGMLKINQGGNVTAVDGLSPAATQLKPQVPVTFSSGAVTSLSVKNHWYFPDSGICLFTHPTGASYLFSYSSKSQPGGPASQTLDGILWQSQPREDFTPLVDPGPGFATNSFRGDGRIEYWARPPIQISGANNKIDFNITIDGVETTHAATVPSGWYSADLIPLGRAIVDALIAAKTLPPNHEYFCTYSKRAQLWSIGVEGDRIQKINFRWSTGANSGTSIASVLGFSSDVIDATSYLAQTSRQHEAVRVFVGDDNLRSSEHQSIKYAVDAGLHVSTAEADQMIQYGGLSGYRRYDAQTNRGFLIIYPDEDACGMSLMFLREDIGMYVTYSIDDGDETYLVQTSRPNDVADPSRGAIIHTFISFPKGSRKITIKAEFNAWFEIEASTQFLTFFGYRQFFTKPQWETLSPTEKVLKTFEINPIRMFATAYGHNAALYTPQPTNDNINTITESGTWTNTTTATIWNQRNRQSTTVNGYVDVEFVLQGDGGGIGIRRFDTTDTTRRLAFYLAAGAINESTDLVEFASTDWVGVQYKKDFQHIGLPAGTYTLRMKNLDTQRQINNAIIVYDTVVPQANARTLSEVSNTGQSLSWPIHTRKRESSRYQSFRQPSYYPEGTYKPGIVHHADYLVATHSILLRDETVDVVEEADVHWLAQLLTNTGEYAGYRTFCRSISAQTPMFSTYTTAVQPNVDGRNLNTVSMREQAKGGLAPSSTRFDNCTSVFFDFEYPCAHSTGETFTMADTRGLRAGRKAILLTSSGDREEVFIDSFVTDVSFTISRALQVLNPADVVKIQFHGFHNIRMTSVDAADWYMSAFAYEPLPIEESVLPIRVQTERREETLFRRQTSGSVAAGGSGIKVSQRIPFPVHSDGEEGTFYTMQWLDGQGSAISYVTTASSHFNPFLRANISAAATAIAANTPAIVSRKWVKAISDLRVKG